MRFEVRSSRVSKTEDKVLSCFKWQIALVYIDHRIICSNDYEQHVKNIDTVFSLVAKSAPTLSLKKCHLAYQSMTALGHINPV
jgi:hypothetical protein